MKKTKKDDNIGNEKRKILMNKNFGFGINDFREFREKNCFYIDKSLFIKEAMNCSFKVMLITRPRRFGKSLNLSMLNHYLNINENSKDIFDGLKIMNESAECLDMMNAYPVVYLSFNGITASNYENMIEKIKTKISIAFKDHMYLLDSDKLYDVEKEDFLSIANKRYPDKFSYLPEEMIYLLTEFLYRHFGKRVIFLLDEYDVPLLHSYTKGYYDDAIEFFKSFFGLTLKDNNYLEKGVLTGVSRVSKESIFSDLNSIGVYTVLDKDFSDCFGFTEEEVKCVLTKYEIDKYIDGMKKFYNGYIFGNKTEIYNPWSVLNYFKSGELKSYWVNTSSNDLIKMIFAKSGIEVKETLEDLINGKEALVVIDLNTVIPNIEKNDTNIWGLFLQTGYLKPIKKVSTNKYIVKVPNNEVKELFETIVSNWCYSVKSKTLNYLINQKFDMFEESFQALALEMFSFLDVDKNEDENFYHAFTLGMMVELKEKYVVLSNRESGFGRYDICLEPLNKNAPAFIIEFKSCKEKSFEVAIEEAKDQIIKQKYETDLRQRGCTSITKMALAFKGKDIKMEIFD